VIAKRLLLRRASIAWVNSLVVLDKFPSSAADVGSACIKTGARSDFYLIEFDLIISRSIFFPTRWALFQYNNLTAFLLQEVLTVVYQPL
jgi:hypothetical protein